jgi:hypothetical protein
MDAIVKVADLSFMLVLPTAFEWHKESSMDRIGYATFEIVACLHVMWDALPRFHHDSSTGYLYNSKGQDNLTQLLPPRSLRKFGHPTHTILNQSEFP